MVFALDGYSLLRFCGASVLLLGIYYGLYDRKACFLHCRCYLLLMVLLAASVSVLRIPVYDSGREFVVTPVRAGEVVEDALQGQAASWQSGNPVAPTENVRLAEEVEMPGKEEKVWESWQTGEVLFLIYGIVAFVFLLRWVFAVVGILRLKRWGSCEEWEGMLVVRNNRVASPFSFFKMIFVNRKLQGETLRVVLDHEKTHIEHKHYRDTLVIEMFCIFFWFNPFVWLVKRELMALHEFEVDRYLLNHGIELSKYQHIIFNELMGYGPAIANGFHNSMIKKRFIMMKTVNNIRYGLLRKMMLLPAVAGLTVLFAFTDKETVKERIWLPFMEDVRMEEVVAVNPALPDASHGLAVAQAEVAPIAMPDRHLEETQDTLKESPVVVDDSVAQQKYAPFRGREGFMFYPLTDDQVVVSSLPFKSKPMIKSIETYKYVTVLRVLVPICSDNHYMYFSQEFCMEDCRTFDIYRIRSIERDIELNKTVVIKGKKGKMVEFALIFPKLKKRVKKVNIFLKSPEEAGLTPTNAAGIWNWREVEVSRYKPSRMPLILRSPQIYY